MEDQSIKKIGQNIKFDYIIFYKRGIKINSLEDTMLMSYVLDAGRNRHNLDILAEIHLQHKNISFKEVVGTGKKQLNFSEVDIITAKDGYSAARIEEELIVTDKGCQVISLFPAEDLPISNKY